MPSLKEIRAKLKEAEEKRSGNRKTGTGDKLIYPFWNMNDGDQATIRFLPDKNEDNTFFWVERQLIKLKFPGVKGGNQSKEVLVQVPCMEMWQGESCPVLTEIRPWFNDKSMEDLARSYWKKRTYIFQGIVREDALDEGEEAPENIVRKFVIGPQLFNGIKQALMDPDMENIPTDYLNGTDYRIVKGSKGGYANYDSSNWARKESSLSEDELSAVDENGLVDLSSYLPNKPTPEAVNAIYEMFLASVEGELYDPERWASFYKPYGLEYSGKTSEAKPAAPAPAPAAAPAAAEAVTATAEDTVSVSVDTTDDLPFDVDEADKTETGEQSAKDILAMIRARG
jgi:hypothetical protein